ncbi:MAG: hypothetical protein ACT4OO_14225 [Nitrospiraceae bacterium]
MNEVRESPPVASGILSGGAKTLAECTRDDLVNQKNVLAHVELKSNPGSDVLRVVGRDGVVQGETTPLYEVTFRPVDAQRTRAELRTSVPGNPDKNEVWAIVQGCANR